MPTKTSKEQFWKLYEGLPQELKDSLFAVETGDYIEEACKKNGVEKNLFGAVELVGQVLLGLALPEDFQAALEKETKMKKDVAKRVSQEINRFIFYPVKESLANLHKIEAGPTNGIPTQMKPLPSETNVDEEKIPAAAPEPTPRKPDIYKEEIE